MRPLPLLSLGLLARASFALNYTLVVSRSNQFSLAITDESNRTIVSNDAVLAGKENSTASAVDGSSDETQIDAKMITATVARVQIKTTLRYTGAEFSANSDDFYGVWEYPWDGSIRNTNVSFDLKGTESNPGTNYANARSPFFISRDGYAVYADTLNMGSYSFDSGDAQFIFNTTELTYYIILPAEEHDFKGIIEQYSQLSNTVQMFATSAYGPTFWSDSFEEGFHGDVSNAQENINDVVDHLYHNKIRASAIFADRPYGTGDQSWGNFNFDPEYYPSPKAFIANLSDYGIDFQVWVANRANPGTELENVAAENGWLFEGVDPDQGLGPALNLSIPEAYSTFKELMANFSDLGVKGYKIDRGEEGEMPVYEQNVQMSLFEELCFETMAEPWGAPTATSPGGFYNFARSAVDRSRNSTGIWNGDTAASYQGLVYSIGSAIRSGLIGFPVWGSDTGGFRQSDGQPDEELWARWMWFSAFSPVYEIMIGPDNTPWYDYSDELVDVLRESAALHHDLLPFIQSYIFQSNKNGLPLVRALFLEASTDEAAYTTDEEYFFGKEFLVAPIDSASGQKRVYFPEGSKYLEYFNKTDVYDGGETQLVQMDIHALPVYVREGSIIPRGDIYQGNNKWTEDWKPSLSIEAYPSFAIQESTFSYFSEVSGGAVSITMTTNEADHSVKIEYGDFGVDGTLTVYSDAGNKTFSIVSGGGRVELDDVETLFD